ncbi:MAG: hypothetical protein GWP38_03355 [Planctomycetia bacterium]|nr:hypothetical protein [Planctomycetia bacterium]
MITAQLSPTIKPATLKNNNNKISVARRFVDIILLLILTTWVASPTWAQEEESPSRLPDHPIPLIDESLIQPHPPIIQIGPGLMETGRLERGFDVPGGAVWRPSFWVYGNLRSGINVVEPAGAGDRIVEWAQRMDLFGNLQLTGTERFLIGMQPLHQRGSFSRYVFEPESEEGWVDEVNDRITTFFFEGELSELFPVLDPDGTKKLDYGFSVGRWRVDLQDGLLVNDAMDAVGVTRFVSLPGTATTRMTVIAGWDEVSRDNNLLSTGSRYLSFSAEADTYKRTIDFDVVHVEAPEDEGGSGWFIGLGSSQRLKSKTNTFNTTIRLCSSMAADPDNAAVSDGTLLFAEASTTPAGTMDNAYATFFLGIDEFASAARGETNGGPLGKAGLLFAAAGLGRYKPALGNRADDSYGGSVGYQFSIDEGASNLVFELGGRSPLEGDGPATGAFGSRYQKKLTGRTMLQMDAYTKKEEGGDSGYGLRAELLMRF